jgi:hypothetical protein
MELILIFDRDFGPAKVCIAVGCHIKFRDRAVQINRRISLDGSFIGPSIQAKPIAA